MILKNIKIKNAEERECWAVEPIMRPLRTLPPSPFFRDFFFIFVFKKKSKIYGGFEKFQNYTPVAPCLGDRGLSPSGWATGPKCKKITFRSWRPGRIKQRTCNIYIKS